MPLLSEQNRRKRNVVIIASFLVLIGSAAVFDLGVFAPELPVASNIVIFALFNLNLIVFLLLLVLLFRNLVKVWLERQANVIGARFRAKLVLAFLVAGGGAGRADLRHRLQLHQQVDRGLVQAAGGAAARPGAVGRPDLLQQPRAHRAPPRPAHRPRHRPRRPAGRGPPRGAGLLPGRAAGPARHQHRSPSSNGHGQELVHVKDPILGDLPTRDLEREPAAPGPGRPGGDDRARAGQRRPHRGGDADLVRRAAATASVVGAVVDRQPRDRAPGSRRCAGSRRPSWSTSSSSS